MDVAKLLAVVSLVSLTAGQFTRTTTLITTQGDGEVEMAIISEDAPTPYTTVTTTDSNGQVQKATLANIVDVIVSMIPIAPPSTALSTSSVDITPTSVKSSLVETASELSFTSSPLRSSGTFQQSSTASSSSPEMSPSSTNAASRSSVGNSSRPSPNASSSAFSVSSSNTAATFTVHPITDSSHHLPPITGTRSTWATTASVADESSSVPSGGSLSGHSTASSSSSIEQGRKTSLSSRKITNPTGAPSISTSLPSSTGVGLTSTTESSQHSMSPIRSSPTTLVTFNQTFNTISSPHSSFIVPSNGQSFTSQVPDSTRLPFTIPSSPVPTIQGWTLRTLTTPSPTAAPVPFIWPPFTLTPPSVWGVIDSRAATQITTLITLNNTVVTETFRSADPTTASNGTFWPLFSTLGPGPDFPLLPVTPSTGVSTVSGTRISLTWWPESTQPPIPWWRIVQLRTDSENHLQHIISLLRGWKKGDDIAPILDELNGVDTSIINTLGSFGLGGLPKLPGPPPGGPPRNGGGGSGGKCKAQKCFQNIFNLFGCVFKIVRCVGDTLSGAGSHIEGVVKGLVGDLEGLVKDLPDVPEWPPGSDGGNTNGGGGGNPDKPTPDKPNPDKPDPDKPDPDEPDEQSSTEEKSTTTSTCSRTETATSTITVCSSHMTGTKSTDWVTSCSTSKSLITGCSVTNTASTTTVPACTSSQTATDKFVTCSPSRTGTASSETTWICSSRISVVTGCTARATTTTTSLAPCPTTVDGIRSCIPLCDASFCGPNACEPPGLPPLNSTLNGTRSVNSKFDPHELILSDPASDSVQAFDSFMIYEYTTAWNARDIVPYRAGQITSSTFNFGRIGGNFAVQAIYGCTAVVVISRQGVFGAHLWQTTFFEELPAQSFGEVIEELLQGDHSGYNAGLSQYTAPGYMFDPAKENNNLNAYIITPTQQRDEDDNVGADPRYDTQVTMMKQRLDTLLRIDTKVLQYEPVTYTLPDDATTSMISRRLRGARGKVVIQYDPAQISGSCLPGVSQQAMGRLWVDVLNHRRPIWQNLWDALPSQQDPKRDAEGQSCWYCSPLTCGAASCRSDHDGPDVDEPAAPSNASTKPALPALHMDVLARPRPGEDAFNVFMRRQSRSNRAVLVAQRLMPALGPDPEPEAGKYGSSSNVKRFDTEAYNLALRPQLWGCTSLVVMSRRGAWMTHSWERPLFEAIDNMDDFIQDLFEGDHSGYLPGLNTVMEDFFPEGEQRWVFIITPLNKKKPSQPLYLDVVNKLSEALQTKMGVAPAVWTYRRIVDDLSPMGTSDWDDTEIDDVLANSAHGRVVLQYDPKQVPCSDGTRQQAEARLWVDIINGRRPVLQEQWEANEHQRDPECDSCAQIANKAINTAGDDSADPYACILPCDWSTCGGKEVCKADDPTSSNKLVGDSPFNTNILTLEDTSGMRAREFDDWMIEKIQTAHHVAQRDPNAGRFGTSSEHIDFRKEAAQLSLAPGLALYGCTSVVVLTKRGAWLSHMWQLRMEKAIKDDKWDDFIEDMYKGDSSEVQTGLDTVKDELIKPGESDIEIIIVTPISIRSRQNPNPSTPRYSDAIYALRRKLYSATSEMPRIHVYTPITYFFPEARNKPDLKAEMYRILRESSHGKVLVQYDPNEQKCKPDQQQKAKARLYIDTPQAPFRVLEWKAMDDQHDSDCAEPSCSVGARDESGGPCVSTHSSLDTRTHATRVSTFATRTTSHTKAITASCNITSMQPWTGPTETLPASTWCECNGHHAIASSKLGNDGSITMGCSYSGFSADGVAIFLPGITSCDIRTVPGLTDPAASFTGTTYCSCDHSRVAATQTRTGNDHTTTLDCMLSSTTVSGLSSWYSATPTAHPPIPTGVCRIEVFQVVRSLQPPAGSFYAEVYVYGPHAKLLMTKTFDSDFSESGISINNDPWHLTIVTMVKNTATDYVIGPWHAAPSPQTQNDYRWKFILNSESQSPAWFFYNETSMVHPRLVPVHCFLGDWMSEDVQLNASTINVGCYFPCSGALPVSDASQWPDWSVWKSGLPFPPWLKDAGGV